MADCPLMPTAQCDQLATAISSMVDIVKRQERISNELLELREDMRQQRTAWKQTLVDNQLIRDDLGDMRRKLESLATIEENVAEVRDGVSDITGRHNVARNEVVDLEKRWAEQKRDSYKDELHEIRRRNTAIITTVVAGVLLAALGYVARAIFYR